MERGKPVDSPSSKVLQSQTEQVGQRESEPQGTLTDLPAEDGGRSECLPVMGRTGVESSGFDREQDRMATSLHAKAGRLSILVARHEKVRMGTSDANHFQEGKHKTAGFGLAGAPSSATKVHIVAPS
jgi:hypothetical protein